MVIKKQRTYNEILSEYKSSWFIPYQIILELKEWKEFRTGILERDNYTCLTCKKQQSEKVKGEYYRELTEEEIQESQKEELLDLTGDGDFVMKMKTAPIVAQPTDTPTILHVHHRYYIFAHAPWEYPTSAVTTLCHDCHLELHNTLVIPVYYDESKQERIPLTACKRCSGTGFMPQYSYFKNGICFRCNGRKFEEFTKS